MQTKICTVCNVEKPATLEFFRVNITHKYGLYSKCKICEHFYVKEYRKNHIEKIRLWERNTRLRKKGLLPSRLKSSENQLERRRKYCKKYYFTFKKYKHTKMKLCVLGKMIRYNRGCKLKNNAPIDKLVGYDTITLSKHIESQFRDGMCWNNYNQIWNIDHIRPVSSFEKYPYTKNSIRQCWKLSNLQPLLIRENAKKGSKYIKANQ